MKLAYFRPVPVGAWPFEKMALCSRDLPAEAAHWSRGRARQAGLACGACGKVDFRRDRKDDNPATLPFEVPGPDGELRLECGGCRPEFIDPAAVPAPRPGADDLLEAARTILHGCGFDLSEDGFTIRPREAPCGCDSPFDGLQRAVLAAQGVTVPTGVSDAEIRTVNVINTIADLYRRTSCPGPLVVHHDGVAECHHPGCPGLLATAHSMEATDPCSMHPDPERGVICARCSTQPVPSGGRCGQHQSR